MNNEITNEDLQQLKALAMAATPGPWGTDDPYIVYAEPVKGEILYIAKTTELDCNYAEAVKNAAFIAAANPALILALIARIESLAADAERYQWLRQERNIGFKYGVPWVVNLVTEHSIPTSVRISGGRLDVAINAAIAQEKK